MKGSNGNEQGRTGRNFFTSRPRIAANLPGAAMMNGVDLDRLMSLRDDIGPEDFADVVLLFFAEIGETLDRMRAIPPPDGG
jgi:hypothetical protein